MEMFLTNNSIIFFLHAETLPFWVQLIKLGFSFYPPYNFSKAYMDISEKSGKHFDNYQFKWVQGEGYTWADLFKRNRGQLRLNVTYDVKYSYYNCV